jgi:hypothetical protein
MAVKRATASVSWCSSAFAFASEFGDYDLHVACGARGSEEQRAAETVKGRVPEVQANGNRA